MSWRPDNYKSPIPVVKPIPKSFPINSAYHRHLLIEAGADAIVEAQKKDGKYCDGISPIVYSPDGRPGWLVFIPEEVMDGKP